MNALHSHYHISPEFMLENADKACRFERKKEGKTGGIIINSEEVIALILCDWSPSCTRLGNYAVAVDGSLQVNQKEKVNYSSIGLLRKN